MTQLRIVSASLAASAVFLMSSLASAIAAPAPGCGTGPACAYGFECTVVGMSGCASAACAPGQTCPPPDPCTPTEESACTPAHCAADADCSSGMVCHEWTQPCAVADCACAPNTPDCNCGAPTTCEPTTVSMCTPRYLLPCEAATDCGDGFTCEEQSSCACAGSAGSGTPSSPGAAPLPPDAAGGAPASDPIPPDCMCEPSGVKQCVAKPMTCQTAADCPAGWSCDQDVIATEPACMGADCGALPAPMPAQASCRPPYYGAQSGHDLEVPGNPTTTTGSGTGTTGMGGGTGSSLGTAGKASAPEANATDDGQAHESAACSLGHAPASRGAFALLAMAAALLGLKRRRN